MYEHERTSPDRVLRCWMAVVTTAGTVLSLVLLFCQVLNISEHIYDARGWWLTAETGAFAAVMGVTILRMEKGCWRWWVYGALLIMFAILQWQCFRVYAEDPGVMSIVPELEWMILLGQGMLHAALSLRQARRKGRRQ